MKKRKYIKLLVVSLFTMGVTLILFNYIVKKCVGIKTEVAEISEIENSIEVVGYVARDEKILKSNNVSKDRLKYIYADGEKIPKDGVYAEVYGDETSAKNGYMIDNLNSEIEILEELDKKRYKISGSVNLVNSQIYDEINNLFFMLNNSEFYKSKNKRKELKYLLNERQMILNNMEFSKKIEELKNQRDKYISSSCKTVGKLTVPFSGNFLGSVDGYEDAIEYSNIKNIDLDNVSIDEINSSGYGDDVVGKIIVSPVWYMICTIDGDFNLTPSAGMDIKINVPSIDSDSRIPAKIEAVKKSEKDGAFKLLVSCDYVNKDLLHIRKENFKLIFNNFSGLKISREAIHKIGSNLENQEYGVYVKIDNYIKLKKITPIFMDNYLVVVKYEDTEYIDENYLQVGDHVVISGRDIHDEKIV